MNGPYADLEHADGAHLVCAFEQELSPDLEPLAIGARMGNTILDNLGCLPADGRVWCGMQELGGEPRGYVAADF